VRRREKGWKLIMDGQRFDRIVQSLGRGMSRRGVLGVLAGLAAMGATEAAAGRRGRRRRKRALRAEANQNANLGNSTCAKWCHENLAGKAAGQCTADAAKGEGPCYECGPAADPDGGHVFCEGSCVECCGDDGDCCSPQVCGDNNQCVIACGSDFCDPKSQKCCTPTSGEPVCISFDQCCSRFGGVTTLGSCLRSTNAANAANNRPNVELVSTTEDSITLRFSNPQNTCVYFEYRIDDKALTCGEPHEVVIGDWEYPGVLFGGPCGGPGPVEQTFQVNEKIEIRHALGAENNWYFESTNSGWITFTLES
jgi:hypothetical protein